MSPLEGTPVLRGFSLVQPLVEASGSDLNSQKEGKVFTYNIIKNALGKKTGLNVVLDFTVKKSSFESNKVSNKQPYLANVTDCYDKLWRERLERQWFPPIDPKDLIGESLSSGPWSPDQANKGKNPQIPDYVAPKPKQDQKQLQPAQVALGLVGTTLVASLVVAALPVEALGALGLGAGALVTAGFVAAAKPDLVKEPKTSS